MLPPSRVKMATHSVTGYLLVADDPWLVAGDARCCCMYSAITVQKPHSQATIIRCRCGPSGHFLAVKEALTVAVLDENGLGRAIHLHRRRTRVTGGSSAG